MNQNQSEGTAANAKVKTRRVSPHSISRLPDVNTLSGTQQLAAGITRTGREQQED